MIEARKNKSINNSPSEIKEGIKPPNDWDIKTNDIMPHDTISLFEVLDSPYHRLRHTLTRTFIVITGRLICFSIKDCNTVDLGSIIE